jgi:hypothetical protein
MRSAWFRLSALLLLSLTAALICAQPLPPSAASMLAMASSAANGPTVTLVSPGFSNEQCRVTNTSEGGLNNLDALYDMHAADQGTVVADPVSRTTWIFFGDTADTECTGPNKADCLGTAWYGSFGGNAIGYLSGADFANPNGLCGSMGVETQPGLSPPAATYAFAPDLHTDTLGDAITNYLFQSPTPPPSPLPNGQPVLPTLAANQAISGINEGPSGGFFYKGNIYTFYAGGPGRAINSDCSIGLPRKSVSYLAVWQNPTTPDNASYAPPDYQILSRADYNLEAFTLDQGYATTQACATINCGPNTTPTEVLQNDGSGTAQCECIGPGNPTGLTCSSASPPSGYIAPTTPGDWRASPPLGGNFVWITPLIAPAEGFLYLFGTGQFRASPVYLARLPLTHLGQDFPQFVTQYLADAPGLKFYNSSLTPPWDSNAANATPLDFDGDANAGLGEVSVRYFNDAGVFLMAYSHSTGSGQQVVVRWATTITGLWHELIALDMTQQINQCNYCSNADAPTCSGLGITVPSPQAFTQCYPSSLYAPDLLPYPTNVSTSLVGGQPVMYFTVSYLLSTFVPYDSVLFNVDLQATNPNLIFANGFES